MKSSLLLIITVLLPSWSASAQTITDIDGNTYATINIGPQVWMAENLNTTRFRNGGYIQNAIPNITWTNLILSPGRCYPNNDSVNTHPYGALYNFYAVTSSSELCPVGWHVPSDSEWNMMSYFLDNTVDTNFAGATGTGTVIGNILKDTGTTYWDVGNTGTNSSGFAARGGGYRTSGGSYNGFLTFAYFWTSSFAPQSKGWIRSIGFNDPGINRFVADRLFGANVRCVQDSLVTSSTGSELERSVFVYPNPTNDRITVFCSECRGAVLTLTDGSGRKVKELTVHGNETQLDISGLRPGIHVINLTDGTNVHRERLSIRP